MSSKQKASVAKGKRAERAFVNLVKERIEGVSLSRNLNQTVAGGFDVSGIEGLAIEIKHREQLSLNTWWKQTIRQSGDSMIPILAYRQNRVDWKIQLGHGRQDLTLDEFIEWLAEYVTRLDETKDDYKVLKNLALTQAELAKLAYTIVFCPNCGHRYVPLPGENLVHCPRC